ncbi:(2Fe-2S)-binding protein [Actibacterium sp. 188UL27-1]|uniref:(2Fe-2S)-binding protein n=1 Tax=Actibacterium sp. 188UL27-1 TaxID=2786961 RepID=UPI00195AF640|nr:(2Fe-2S)-binding protein [Actibacterium sp. 188UL27-1]MBM7068770.1 (2Fe-2S)-binding protein [Actibacterium sp. 188UL27-1]
MTSLTINDTPHVVEVEPDTPLLWVLRDILNLTGTKYGCGAGLCGACTVHVNGIPERSCQVSIGDLNGASVTTIEGIGTPGQLSILQQEWVACQVAQCGYCQSGQLMQATALLQENSAPTDEDINAAMSGNLCRCGSYPRLRAAIHAAAKRMAD